MLIIYLSKNLYYFRNTYKSKYGTGLSGVVPPFACMQARGEISFIGGCNIAVSKYAPLGDAT